MDRWPRPEPQPERYQTGFMFIYGNNLDWNPPVRLIPEQRTPLHYGFLRDESCGTSPQAPRSSGRPWRCLWRECWHECCRCQERRSQWLSLHLVGPQTTQRTIQNLIRNISWFCLELVLSLCSNCNGTDQNLPSKPFYKLIGKKSLLNILWVIYFDPSLTNISWDLNSLLYFLGNLSHAPQSLSVWFCKLVLDKLKSSNMFWSLSRKDSSPGQPRSSPNKKLYCKVFFRK